MSSIKSRLQIPKHWYNKYIFVVLILTIFISIFSSYMQDVADERNELANTTYESLDLIYNARLKQTAPMINELDSFSNNYKLYNLTPEKVRYYIDNTHLISTNGEVTILADFVKKGLIYQPTFKNYFKTEYVLENTLSEESVVSFDFPFPTNTNQQEISNAKILVDGVEQINSKAKVKIGDGTTLVDGLKWEGKIPPLGTTKITISYNTVGLSNFQYDGFENSLGAQNFYFKVNIQGTRMYDVLSGLSVDRREFGNESTTLIWEKESLYNTPSINISVGDKLNPSVKVARVYKTMTPIYIVFIISVIFLANKFGKNLKIIDLGIISAIFTLFFPFFHYLSSFKLDPTIEIFSKMNVSSYSLGLYPAFLIAFIILGILMFYMIARTQSMRFATKLGLPIEILALGYFPLVATIPEYFGLLSLIGIIFATIVVIQIRLSLNGGE